MGVGTWVGGTAAYAWGMFGSHVADSLGRDGVECP